MKCSIYVKKWISDHSSGGLHPMANHEMNIQAQKQHKKFIDSLPRNDFVDSETEQDDDKVPDVDEDSD